MSPSAPAPSTPPKELLAGYRALIEDRFGLRLTDYQARNLERSILDLLAATHFGEALEMYQAFAAGWRTDLLQVLVAGITVGETHFFRIRPQIEALRQVVLPDLIRRRAQQRALRVWSAGCATGEEPYTLAILLRELLPNPESWRLHVLGSDVNGIAIDAARRAVYRDWSFRDTPTGVRERYFVAEPPQYWHLVKEVRNMVEFSQLNLLQDPPPGPAPLDLILCRNVTIYFSPEAVQRVYTRFADRLASDGWLVLGPSDPVPTSMFEPEWISGAVLWRKVATTPSVPITPPSTRRELPPPTTGRQRIRRGPGAPAAIEATRARVPVATALAGRELAERAVAVEPLNAEAHLVLGMLQMDDGALEPALISLRRPCFSRRAIRSLTSAWAEPGHSRSSPRVLAQSFWMRGASWWV